jgi:hypothetical protein
MSEAKRVGLLASKEDEDDDEYPGKPGAFLGATLTLCWLAHFRGS